MVGSIKTVNPSSDNRSPMARATEWSSRVTSIALCMVVPGLVGYWLDLQWGTKPALLIGGVILGFISGLWQLIKLASESLQQEGKSTSPPKDR